MKAFVVPSIFTAIDKFSRPMQKMTVEAQKYSAEMARLERNWRHFGNSAMNVGRQSAIFSAALIAPLVLITKKAVEFEDKMADVGKTTGMQGAELAAFGDQMLEMSTKTRTGIDDLVKIGEIGGQLGVVKTELLAFTEAANQFTVALGGDFSGGTEEAISSVGSLKALFAQTRNLDISEVIRRSGSAINELGAVGSGTSANITDFTLRLGALPDALKPSITDTMALATALEEMGIKSEIGARGIGDVITTAGSNLPAFAEQMKISAEEAANLLNTDSTEFMKKFAKSFEGMSTIDLSDKLKALKIGDTGTIKVIGALSSGTERLTQLQEIANDSFEKGTSLQSEYEKKNSTAAAKWEILKNNVHAAAITLGQAFLPVLLDLMEEVTPMIQSFAKWAKQNKQFLGTILKIVAGIATFSAGISVLSFGLGGFAKAMAFAIRTVAFFKTSTVVATIATKAMNAVMMMTPWGMVAAGAAALAIGIYAVSKAFNTKTASERVNAELQERVLEQTLDQRAELKILTDTMRTHNQSSSAYIEALAKIEAMQPGITEKYNLQEKSIRNISAAERELTENILKRARADAASQMLTERYKALLEVDQKMSKITKEGGAGNFEYQVLSQAKTELNSDINSIAKMGVTPETELANPGWERQMAMTNVADEMKKQKIEITVKGDGTFSINQTGDQIGKVNATMPTTTSTR